MNTYYKKQQGEKNQSTINTHDNSCNNRCNYQITDNRPTSIIHQRYQETADNSPKVSQLKAIQKMAHKTLSFVPSQSQFVKAQLSQIRENKNGLPSQVIQGMFYEHTTDTEEPIWHWGPVIGKIWKKKMSGGNQVMHKGYGVWERKTNEASGEALTFLDYINDHKKSILGATTTTALGYFILSALESLPTTMAQQLMEESNTTNSSVATSSDTALGPAIVSFIATNATFAAYLIQHYAMTRASDNTTTFAINGPLQDLVGHQTFERHLSELNLTDQPYYENWDLHELPGGTMERDQQDGLNIPVDVYELGGVIDIINNTHPLVDGQYIYVLRPNPSTEDGTPQLLVRPAGDGETLNKLLGYGYGDNFRNPDNITERCPDPSTSNSLYRGIMHRMPQRISGCQYERVRHTQLRGTDESGQGWGGVYCAGELTVSGGKVTDSNNASGHYKPPANCTTRVEQTLENEKSDVLAEDFTRRDHENRLVED